MRYKIPDSDLVAKQAERVLALTTMETIKKGYVEPSEVISALDIPVALLQQVKDLLISQGKIEEIT